jgi:hypothetical protein
MCDQHLGRIAASVEKIAAAEERQAAALEMIALGQEKRTQVDGVRAALGRIEQRILRRWER